MEKNSLMFNQM